MKKLLRTFLFLIIMLIVSISFLVGCKAGTDDHGAPAQEMRIGYCPTMKPVVENLVDDHPNLSLVQYQSSVQAMNALHANAVDGVFIGRIANQGEITENLRLVRVEDGYALIAAQRGMILYDDLQHITVLTIEDSSIVVKLLPDGTSIQYYQNLEQMFSETQGANAVLLRWSQVSPSHYLLIPVDQSGNKVPIFRSPHFYYLIAQEENLVSLISSVRP